MPRSVKYLFVCLLVLGTARCASGPLASTAASASGGAAPEGRAVVARKDVSHALRLHGTVEAQNAVAIVVPRILGQNINALVVTRLVANGSRVKAGDLVVEFDRQAQLNLALEKKAEFRDLDEQVTRGNSLWANSESFAHDLRRRHVADVCYRMLHTLGYHRLQEVLA